MLPVVATAIITNMIRSITIATTDMTACFAAAPY